MPRKKHRLSWMYEEPKGETAPDEPTEEDALAVSPVEVTYSYSVFDASTEAPAVAAEEPAAAAEERGEEAWRTGPPVEDLSEDDYPAVEEGPLYQEIDRATEEAPIPEEAFPPEEPPALEEMPAQYPPIREANRDHEAEVVPKTDVLTGSEVGNAVEETAETQQQPNNQPGEIVLVCTSCTIMLLIEYDGPCPYYIAEMIGPIYESYSWLVHTTCRSCVKKHTHNAASRSSFGGECVAAFATAVLSEAFMKQTRWFDIADRVCRKPTQIVMDEGRKSVAYVDISVLRDETTEKCRIRGLRSVGELSGEVGRNKMIEPFVPGGFL